MAKIAKHIEKINNRLNMNLGANFNNECQNVQPLGSDAAPLPGDFGLTTETGDNGDHSVFAFYDDNNKIAKDGEKRIYARNEKNDVVCEIYLQNTGQILIKNAKASYIIKADGSIAQNNSNGSIIMHNSGDVEINGFIIKKDGSASSPKSIKAPSILVDGKELKDHTHKPGLYLDAEGRSLSGNSGENN